MKYYEEKVSSLRKDLLNAIKEIMANNELTDITFHNENAWFLYYTDCGDVNECLLHRLQLRNGELTICVKDRKDDEIYELDGVQIKLQKMDSFTDSIEELFEILKTNYHRICHICGKPMESDGFCVREGDEYYCTEVCLHKQYTRKEWEEMTAEDANPQSYWTTWLDDNNHIVMHYSAGQRVFWKDPDKISSGEYKVLFNSCEHYPDLEEFKECDDRMICIGNGLSETHVYPRELLTL